MKLRSLLYAGAVLLTAALGPSSALAAPALGSGGDPFEIAQGQNDQIQENSGVQTGTNDLPEIVGNIINIVLSFLGILLLVYLVYAGFLYMTANGESKNIDKAQHMIRDAIIGLIIIVSSFAISNFVLSALPNITRAG